MEERGSGAVIVASFTRAAAAELAGRDLPLEKSHVGTLHAHCYRALGHPDLAVKIIDQWNAACPDLALSTTNADLDDPLAEVVRDGPGDEDSENYQRLRSMLRPRELWPLSVQSFGKRWEAWKLDAGVLDFTDLIEQTLAMGLPAPGDPQIGFFDEVQDFVPMQLALVRQWGESLDYIVLAGDDDQAIYQWIGATPDAFLDPPVAPERKRVLSQSYRVPRALHRAAQSWVEQLTRREPKEYQPRDHDGDVRGVGASWKEPDTLLLDAERYLSAGKRVMFLGSCGYMLGPLLATLRREGVPFHNPYRRRRGDWNPLTPSKGVSASERLLAYLRPLEAVWGEESREWNPEDLRRWIDVIEAKGVLKHGAKTQLEGVSSAEPLVWPQGIEPYFEEDALWDAIECDLGWFARHLKNTVRQRMSFPLAVAGNRGGLALRQPPQIIIGTIHSVKGGEADVVYVFPDLSRAGYEEWEFNDETRDGVIRMFYVACTRARETLVICEPAGPAVTGLGS